MSDKKLFINPFVLGRIRPGEPFCNRKKEQSDLRTHALNCVDVVIYSSRRLGKTSLLHQVLNSMEHKGYYGIYVDLVSITSESDFIRKVVEGIVLGVGKDVTSRSFPKRIEGLFSRIHPQVEIRIRNQSSEQTLSQVRSGELDLGFRALTAVPPPLHFRPLRPYPRVLIAPKGHPLLKRQRLSPSSST